MRPTACWTSASCLTCIGFLPDLQRILSFLPKARQTLLFSATFSPEIKKLAASYLQEPLLVEVARPNATATNVEQRFYSVTDDDKRAVVRQLLRTRELSQALIFVNSKLGAARLARSFERDGLKTQALHGDKSQDERLKALAAFKAGEVDLLVATDVAARGLDIRAAWTSPTCQGSSTSTCPSTPRITCTASAARGAPAHRAWR